MSQEDAPADSIKRSMRIEREQVIIEACRACELPVKRSQVRYEKSVTNGLTDHYLKMNRTWRPKPRWPDPLVRQCLGRIDSMAVCGELLILGEIGNSPHTGGNSIAMDYFRPQPPRELEFDTDRSPRSANLSDVA